MSEKDDLKSRIEAARNSGKPAENTGNTNRDVSGAVSALGHAFGMVAAVAIGAVIGHTIDRLAGTGPWALLIFLVFGMVAGFLNLFRAARSMAEKAEVDMAARKAAEKRQD